MWYSLLLAAVFVNPPSGPTAEQLEQVVRKHDGFACLLKVFPADAPEDYELRRFYKWKGRYRIDRLPRYVERTSRDRVDYLSAFADQAEIFSRKNRKISGGTILSPLGIAAYDFTANSVGIALLPADDLNVSYQLSNYLSAVNSLHTLSRFSVADITRLPKLKVTEKGKLVTFTAAEVAGDDQQPAGPSHQISVTVDAETGLATRWTDRFESPETVAVMTVETRQHPQLGPVVTRFTMDVDCKPHKEFSKHKVYEMTDYRPWTDPLIFQEETYFNKDKTALPGREASPPRKK